MDVSVCFEPACGRIAETTLKNKAKLKKGGCFESKHGKT
jgi:hypothetical protein